MKEWTEDEVEHLKEIYTLDISMERICEELNRSYDSIRNKARTLFLKRNEKRYSKKPPFSIDWDKIDECSFYIKKHKSAMKDKLWTTLNE